MNAVLHRKSEYRGRSEHAEVEWIHVGVHGAADQAGECLLVTDAVDPGEQRFERGNPFPSMADWFR